jgi:gag-polypeptide of LTR copia-type
MKSVKEIWDAVKADATTKSTLYLLDAEDQLASMKLSDNNDPKTHLAELKQHFQLMLQHHNNLIQMGLTLSDTRFNTVIMLSLPESYRSALQTITAAEQTSAVLEASLSKKMKADDLITFFIEEAQHRVINNECTKSASAGSEWRSYYTRAYYTVSYDEQVKMPI